MNRTFDPTGNRFTEDLSPTLRTEILLHMNRDVIVHCSFLENVQTIVFTLSSCLSLPSLSNG